MKANKKNIKKSEKPAEEPVISEQERAIYTVTIAEAAYFKAEARGFIPGHEREDSLGAKMEYRVRAIGEARMDVREHPPVHLANPAPCVPMLTVDQTKVG
ncbi:MAG: DUF2934 domain-containing protein [Methylomonas sp.]|jgi:hypothetical protein